MNRLTSLLDSYRARGRKALALFLTAGYPAADSTPDLVLSVAAAGADIIEIGIPFSDPPADGPVIQESSAIALANGVTIGGILDDVRKIRGRSPVPLVLMGYINPILSYGADRFFGDTGSAGADGIILPELTLEESSRFRSGCLLNGLSQILLVAPTTPPERVRAIDAASSGFLYCVSTTGVTGSSVKQTPEEFLDGIRRVATRNPLLVGFGISTPEAARGAAQFCDGVIIGSALIRRLARGERTSSICEWVASVRNALDRI